MNILLTNDDGIFAPGLRALYKRFALRHAVIVVAPDQERSAVGHGITLHHPLRASQVALNAHYQGYAVNGTPADCVKLGIFELLPGVNVNYSGTVAAAKEAALYGLPAIAVSVQGREVVNYDDVAAFTESLAETVLQEGLPRGTFLNVNVPNIPFEAISGTVPSRQGIGRLDDRFEKRTDPRNQAYYWSDVDSQVFEEAPDVDGTALGGNHISITPIKCDMTDYRALENLRRWRWLPPGTGRHEK